MIHEIESSSSICVRDKYHLMDLISQAVGIADIQTCEVLKRRAYSHAEALGIYVGTIRSLLTKFRDSKTSSVISAIVDVRNWEYIGCPKKNIIQSHVTYNSFILTKEEFMYALTSEYDSDKRDIDYSLASIEQDLKNMDIALQHIRILNSQSDNVLDQLCALIER